jgi:pimeloyl-ACP methyl ester carboxylesterase
MFIDHLSDLHIDGSRQRVRVCSSHAGLPPLLVVQAGPGLPLLNEVPRLQRELRLEEHFTVYYWEQRGCGPASKRDAERVSLAQQVDDVSTLIQHIAKETYKEVTLLCVSIGATATLLAAARGTPGIRAIVAISPDLKFPDIDLFVASYLYAGSTPALQAKLDKLGPPPYLEPARLQQRARYLMDAGAIQRGRSSMAQTGEFLLSCIKAYGPWGSFKTLRNMSRVQARLQPDLVELDLFPSLPQIRVPVHYLVSPQDPLVPPDILKRLETVAGNAGQQVTVVPDARHMLHLDSPGAVRSVLKRYA